MSRYIEIAHQFFSEPEIATLPVPKLLINPEVSAAPASQSMGAGQMVVVRARVWSKQAAVFAVSAKDSVKLQSFRL